VRVLVERAVNRLEFPEFDVFDPAVSGEWQAASGGASYPVRCTRPVMTCELPAKSDQIVDLLQSCGDERALCCPN